MPCWCDRCRIPTPSDWSFWRNRTAPASPGRTSTTGAVAPTSFDGLASSLADAVIVTSGQVPRRFESRSVTANFFRVLGVSSFHGRLFDESDARPDAARDRRGQPRLLDARVRRRACGDRPDDLAQPQAVHGDRRAAARLSLHDAGGRVPAARAAGRGELSRHAEPQHAHDSLRRWPVETGSHVTAARAEMQTIAAAFALEYPETNKGSGMHVVPLADRVVGTWRRR